MLETALVQASTKPQPGIKTVGDTRGASQAHVQRLGFRRKATSSRYI